MPGLLNEPVPSVENVTVPVAVEGAPLVLMTVAVQVVVAPASTGVVQLTEVEVERRLMSNAVLVAPVSDGELEASIVKPVPALLTDRPPKVAMPPDAGWAEPPVSVALVGLLLKASEIWVVLSPVTRFQLHPGFEP